MSIEQKSGEMQRIAEQLQRLYQGPSWLGPSLRDLIGDIDEEHARRQAASGAHTIWELVLHITAWLRISRERLSATQARDIGPEEDWPAMGESWQHALSCLDSEIRALQISIRNFSEDRLQACAPAREPQTFYHLLHGVIQHSAYHVGQIALLKKLDS